MDELHLISLRRFTPTASSELASKSSERWE